MTTRRAPARRDDPAPRSIPSASPRRAGLLHLLRLIIVLAAMVAPAVALRAQDSAGDGPAVPAPVGFVNDHADKLDEPTRAKLEAFLDQVRQKTGAEFAVLIMPSTAPMDPSEYKTRVFERWGLGKKGEDNGLLMLVALQEHQVRFETGYGLEGVLPDGLQSRIFREEMAPRFRQNDWAGGIIAGVLACATRIAAEKGVTLEWDGQELRYDRGHRSRPEWPFVLAFVLFILFMILARIIGGGGGRGMRRGGWFIGPGGLGGGSFGGFGGGSFGGFGGGGSGGGGSFGGFGGGSSGGGGGGGSW